MRVSWTEDEGHVAHTVEDLDVLLDAATTAAERDRPLVVEIVGANGTLTLGVGDPSGSVLTWFPPQYDGLGSWHSVGDRDAERRKEWAPPLTFFLYGHHSEFARFSAVPDEAAREAARTFFRTDGRRPGNIDWSED